MKSFGPLPLDTLRYFTVIATAKHRARRERLRVLSPVVQGCYETYERNATNLAPLVRQVFTLEQKEDLIHCYESATGALNGLKDDIENHHNLTCPDVAALCQYCGLTYAPSDFDHYLPKEEYPEFSVLPLNLVPCCASCNNLKGTSWVDASGNRTIVSFYYDTLPNRRFLFVDIEVGAAPREVPIARFRLSAHAQDYCGLMDTIHNHYTKLELLGRYRLAAPAKFSDIKVEFGPIIQSLGPSVVTELLLKKARALSQSQSPNYWEVALLYGMADSTAYLNSL